MVRIVSFRGDVKKYAKILIISSGLLLTVCFMITGFIVHNNHVKLAHANQEYGLANAALVNDNKVLALKYAKQALNDQPNSIGNLQLVASLMKANDPSAAKQYYIEAFDKFKHQNNLAGPNTTAVNYWAAAGLAKQAGEISQAKAYYREVIRTARPSNVYEKSIAEQSKIELVALR